VTTTSDGRWTTSLAAGTYNVGVVADGFVPAKQGPLVVAQVAAEVDVALAEGGVAVRGVVSDIGGGPIAGARVSTEVDETYVATFTRPDGSYRLTLDAGYHPIEFSHDDYLTVSDAITVWTLETVHDVALVPAGTIRGIVIARDTGKPVPDAVITPGPNRAQFSDQTKTEADGTFVLHHVSAGDIPLYATGPGYVTTRPTVVSLGVGDSVETRLVADRGYTLRGHVVRKGRPTETVAGVFVDAHTDAAVPDSRSRVATDRDGAFEIVGLAPARYTLSATGDNILDARDIAVAVAGDVGEVQIPVTSGVTVRGRIDPPERVEMSVYARDGYSARNVAHISEDASGAFSATNVPSGEINISASTSSKSGDVSIRVGTADQSGIVIALRPNNKTTTVSGTVVDESNAPIPHALVVAGGDSTLAGDDGTFELYASGPTPIYATFGVEDRTRDREPIMRVTVDKDIRGLVVRIPAAQGEIQGRVVGLDSKAASDVWVSVDALRVLTATDGAFVIKHLRKGAYDVRAESARGDANAIIHKVATGSTIEIVLQTTATLHGHVTMGGAPVPHYELRCQGADYYERRIDATDGTFTFDHVRAVEGRPVECRAATAQGEGHATAVFAGSTANVAIELIPFATITGTILDVFTKQPVTTMTVSVGGRALHSLFAGPQVVDGNGRFELDFVPSEDVQLQIRAGRAFAQATAHPAPGQSLELGQILIVPPARDPVDLGIYAEALKIFYVNNDPRLSELHVGDTIVAIDGVATSVMPANRWSSLLSGSNAERGHTYALSLARGVTVNITAE
jgi:hypothetical protein